MDSAFKKIIALIKKTGDRLIVLETDNPEPYVVMGLADYEALIDGNLVMEKQEPLPLPDSGPNLNDLADSELSNLLSENQSESIFDEEELNEELAAEKREDQYYFEPLEQ